jgi:hypothetical protein
MEIDYHFVCDRVLQKLLDVWFYFDKQGQS